MVEVTGMDPDSFGGGLPGFAHNPIQPELAPAFTHEGGQQSEVGYLNLVFLSLEFAPTGYAALGLHPENLHLGSREVFLDSGLVPVHPIGPLIGPSGLAVEEAIEGGVWQSQPVPGRGTGWRDRRARGRPSLL